MISALAIQTLIVAFVMVGGCYFVGWYATIGGYNQLATHKGLVAGVIAFIGFVLCCVFSAAWRDPALHPEAEPELRDWMSGELGTLIIIGLALAAMGVGTMSHRIVRHARAQSLEEAN